MFRTFLMRDRAFLRNIIDFLYMLLHSRISIHKLTTPKRVS